MASQHAELSALDRRGMRTRRLVSAVAVGVAAVVAGTVVYQLRYDVDTRYVDLWVYEVPSGVDGTASFRACVPTAGQVVTIYTNGWYRASFPGTRSEAATVAACIRQSPNIRQAAVGLAR